MQANASVLLALQERQCWRQQLQIAQLAQAHYNSLDRRRTAFQHGSCVEDFISNGLQMLGCIELLVEGFARMSLPAAEPCCTKGHEPQSICQAGSRHLIEICTSEHRSHIFQLSPLQLELPPIQLISQEDG